MNRSWLRYLYEADESGPFATVYLDASRTDEAGGREIQLRWRRARDHLAEQGVAGLAGGPARGERPRAHR